MGNDGDDPTGATRPATPPGGAVPPDFDDRFLAELDALFAWRRDVRRFRPDKLPDGVLEELLATAARAPSVGLSEPWRFVLVESPARRAGIRACFERANARARDGQGARATEYARLKLAGLDDAPCHLAVFALAAPEQGGGLGRHSMPETTAFSAVLAIHTLWLAARARGFGLGWVSILDPAEAAALLDVPPGWNFVAYLCLGRPEAESFDPELERAGWERRGRIPREPLRR